MKTAALIPARKGSKGIPGKNFRIFCGKPLWYWSLDAALDSGIFDRIIVSSDGGLDDIGDVAVGYWEEVRNVRFDNDRPAELATDKADLDSLLRYYAERNPDIDAWCLLQPTSPLRTAEDIKAAYEMLCEPLKNGDPRYDSVVSVYNHPVLAWAANSVYFKGRKYHSALYHTENRPNRQDRKDWYLENGAVYWVSLQGLMQRGSRVGLMPGLYVMPKERSFEIDDSLDFEICEFLMNKAEKDAQI